MSGVDMPVLSLLRAEGVSIALYGVNHTQRELVTPCDILIPVIDVFFMGTCKESLKV